MIYHYHPRQVHLRERLMVDRMGETTPADDLRWTDDALYVRHQTGWYSRIFVIERWLIPSLGCQVLRPTLTTNAEPLGYDWYIDLDRIERNEGCWTIHDRYLDLTVREGIAYAIHDADELAEALDAGMIDPAEVAAALRALQDVTSALTRHRLSVTALLTEFAPSLTSDL